MVQRHKPEDLLAKALEDLEITQEFLEIDHTAAIHQFQCPPEEHLRTAPYNSISISQPLNLLRILCVRDLALDYIYAWQGSKPLLQRRRYGTIDPFAAERGLPEGVTRKALKIGQKLIDLESQCGIPGISLVLLPAWYMFEHFSEVEELAKLILSDEFETFRHYCVLASLILSTYQKLYGYKTEAN
jgi:hypothetical protein